MRDAPHNQPDDPENNGAAPEDAAANKPPTKEDTVAAVEAAEMAAPTTEHAAPPQSTERAQSTTRPPVDFQRPAWVPIAGTVAPLDMLWDAVGVEDSVGQGRVSTAGLGGRAALTAWKAVQPPAAAGTVRMPRAWQPEGGPRGHAVTPGAANAQPDGLASNAAPGHVVMLGAVHEPITESQEAHSVHSVHRPSQPVAPLVGTVNMEGPVVTVAPTRRTRTAPSSNDLGLTRLRALQAARRERRALRMDEWGAVRAAGPAAVVKEDRAEVALEVDSDRTTTSDQTTTSGHVTPVSTVQLPVPTAQAPVPTAQAPARMTKAPARMTKAPAPTARAPVVTTQMPPAQGPSLRSTLASVLAAAEAAVSSLPAPHTTPVSAPSVPTAAAEASPVGSHTLPAPVVDAVLARLQAAVDESVAMLQPAVPAASAVVDESVAMLQPQPSPQPPTPAFLSPSPPVALPAVPPTRPLQHQPALAMAASAAPSALPVDAAMQLKPQRAIAARLPVMQPQPTNAIPLQPPPVVKMAAWRVAQRYLLGAWGGDTERPCSTPSCTGVLVALAAWLAVSAVAMVLHCWAPQIAGKWQLVVVWTACVGALARAMQ